MAATGGVRIRRLGRTRAVFRHKESGCQRFGTHLTRAGELLDSSQALPIEPPKPEFLPRSFSASAAAPVPGPVIAVGEKMEPRRSNRAVISDDRLNNNEHPACATAQMFGAWLNDRSRERHHLECDIRKSYSKVLVGQVADRPDPFSL